MIKLSIITINLNDAIGLQKTIESVVNQTFTDYEYLVIDGGSTDGSLEVIKKNANKITYWVSEPDKGIYNGMNKGITKAQGEYCLFLNSGDWLVSENVLGHFLSETNNEDFIYGNVDTDRGLIKYAEKLTFFKFFTNTIIHQSVFNKTKLFEQFGFYDESLTIVADWEFYLKTIINGKCSVKYINETLCRFEYTGISSDPKHRKELVAQKERVLRSMFPMMYDDYFTFQSLKIEHQFYLNSKLVQLVKKLQQSNLYKKIRGID